MSCNKTDLFTFQGKCLVYLAAYRYEERTNQNLGQDLMLLEIKTVSMKNDDVVKTIDIEDVPLNIFQIRQKEQNKANPVLLTYQKNLY